MPEPHKGITTWEALQRQQLARTNKSAPHMYEHVVCVSLTAVLELHAGALNTQTSVGYRFCLLLFDEFSFGFYCCFLCLPD